MLWKRASATRAPTPAATQAPAPAAAGSHLALAPTVPAVDPVRGEAAIDTVASFLRAFGSRAFDVDGLSATEVAQSCDRWLQHVVLGAAHPTKTSEDGTPGPRDWPGVRQFLSDHREREHQFVTRTVRDMRQLIWTFVQGLSRSVVDDKTDDGRVANQIARLRGALERNSVEDLKREAESVLVVITETTAARHHRQRTHMEELGQQLRGLREELAEVRKEMATDPLTRLYNRAAFDEQLTRATDLGLFGGQPACLMMVDIDHFKKVNDTFGHPAGDAVLRQVADCCTRAFPRRADFVSRYGGEELAIVIDDVPLATGKLLAERLIASIRALRTEHGDKTIFVTASAGVAELRPGDGPKAWLERADRALYAAKNAGRDRVEVG